MNTTRTNMNDAAILERYATEFWSLYKYAYNVRPRWIDTSTWTKAEFEDEFVRLNQMIESNAKEQAIAEIEAIEKFDIRLQALLTAGAHDVGMAIAWIHEAEGTEGDNDYLCYTLNLPYNYLKNKYNYDGLDESDGQPSEQQEWHDYDPDC